jgi:hypothetical protein
MMTAVAAYTIIVGIVIVIIVVIVVFVTLPSSPVQLAADLSTGPD